ncbi:sulfite exporter TauE/SafE family protein [bacterium]|jgi:uncharacterized protein|nr:sulfite exporter TauE/SafE family protein [bacterium]
MEVLGYGFAILMGMVLGLLGGGGSLLTVPILVYLFKMPAITATGYSLVVVAGTSLFGAIPYIRQKLVDFKIAAVFAVPSMVGVFSSRKWLLPALPAEMSIGFISFTKDQFILVVFAVLVLIISGFMLKKKSSVNSDVPSRFPKWAFPIIVGVEGLLVGVVTGFVGAGGGFMIVPALMFFANLPLRKAIATSLVIISLKSFVGFLGDISSGVTFDWIFLMSFISCTSFGVVLGAFISKKVPVEWLRKGFAYLVMVMGVFIILKEVY